jgi:hypothetical protein
MAKNNEAKLKQFVVKKDGRIVDTVKAKDLCLAFQEAMDRWEPYCAPGALIEVEIMAPAKSRVQPSVLLPTKEEVKEYGVKSQPATAWVENYFTKVNFSATRN